MRVRTGTAGNGAISYAYTDHLGNVVAWTNASGGMVGSSLARYEPFGTYRTKPASAVNPDISDRGFTGHRQNNTGAYDLGLIYMNARYYLPEVGRFISADTIVPEPANPQSFNRYAYSYNDPINLTDPTGHCAGDPNDSDNPDLGCWTLQFHLRDYYRLNRTGDWHFDELLDLLLGLHDIELRLGGLSYFLAAFSGTELHRVQGVASGPDDAPAQVASPFSISFWDSAFVSYEQFATRWLISHEFAHIWDAKDLLLTSLAFERATGGSSCLAEIVLGCDYNPVGETMSGYGRENRREDWAESFAALMYTGDWDAIASSGMHNGINPDAFVVDPTRIIFVASQIRFFQESVNFWQPFSDTFGLGYWATGGW